VGVTEDKWLSRDLPVLQAIVEIYDSTGQPVKSAEIEAKTGMDKETVQRAIRALYTEPYMRPISGSFGGGYIRVGAPTGDALRVAGAWPTPENLLDRLITALEQAGDDQTRPDEERGKLHQAAVWLGSFASQVAIGALGGAGGNIISG
jgi:hypothetical protein